MVFSFGEVLFDQFPDVRVLGGAAYNLAAHLTQLGTPAVLVSAVGPDPEGQEVLRAMRHRGMPVRHVSVSHDWPTGKVSVQLDQAGIPTYDIQQPAAWDYIDFAGVVPPDATLVHGSLALRHAHNRETLYAMVSMFQTRVFDLNLRSPHVHPETILACLQHTDVLKVNGEELQQLGTWCGAPTDTVPEYLLRHYGLKLLLCTLGADGAEAFDDQGRRYVTPGRRVQVADTVGCGDAFLAAFLHYWPQSGIQASMEKAVYLASLVAATQGAVPDYNAHEIP
jgi:fructokinase